MGLKTSIIIDLSGNFERRAREYGAAMGRFTRTTAGHLSFLRRATAVAGAGLERFGNRYTALATGAAGLGSVKFLVGLEARLTQLGINANVSAQGMDELKQQLFDIARMRDVRVDPMGLLEAVEEIVKRTGRLDVARDNLANIGRTMRATGAEGRDVGATIANLFEKFDLGTANAALQAIDTLSLQGKEGAFELRDFATQMNEIAAAYAATGRKGPQAVREMGAIMQMVMRTSGSAPEAATNFERMMATLTSEKVKELQDHGITIFDPVQLKKGIKEFRPIPDIIKDIVKATKGDEEKLSTVFDIRALRAIRAFGLEFKSGRGFEAFDKFLAMQGNGSQLLEDSARNARTAAAAMQNLATAWKKFADANLTAPIQALADLLDKLGSERTNTAIKALVGIGLGIAALKVGRSVYRGVGGLFGGGAGAAGAIAGGMPIPLPVYVVNQRGNSYIPEIPGGPGGAGGKAGGRVGMLSRLGRFAAVAGAGVAGWEGGKWINENFVEGTAMSSMIGRALSYGLAMKGNKDALESILLERQAKGAMNGELKITIEDGRAKVTRLRSQNLDIDVDTGPTGYMFP